MDKNLDTDYLFDLEMRLKLINKKKSIDEIPIKTRYGTERSLFHLKYALLFLIKSILNKIKKYNFKYYLRLLSKIKYLKLINKTNTTKKLFIYPKLP